MTDEKKKKVKRYAAIVIALVLATGALAFSVWRFVATVQKKYNHKEEVTSVTTETRGVKPALDYTTNGMVADDVILTSQITFDRGGDGVFLLKVENTVYRDVADYVGYSLSNGGGFATIQLYIFDLSHTGPAGDYMLPELTDDRWSEIGCDLGDLTVSLPGSELAFNVIKGSDPYVSFGYGYAANEDDLPRSTEDLSHYVMFAVVPLHKNDGSSTSDSGTWQYFRSTYYRMSDLFAMPVSGNGGGSAGGYTEADLEAARIEAVNDYINSVDYREALEDKYNEGLLQGYANGSRDVLDSEEYKNGLQAKYDEGYASGKEDYDIYGAQRYNDGLRDGRTQAMNDIDTGKNLFFGILDAPFQLIKNIFNFEILGINISAVIFFILSVLLIAFVIRKLKG